MNDTPSIDSKRKRMNEQSEDELQNKIEPSSFSFANLIIDNNIFERNICSEGTSMSVVTVRRLKIRYSTLE